MFEHELNCALEAAERASRLVLEHYAGFTPIPDAPANISTDTDRQSQEIILQCLRERFPADAYRAEESTPSLTGMPSSGPRLWIIDPIDGTRGFARKNGEFAVMLAFLHEERVVVGVVAEPARSRLTYAMKGGGCWRHDVENSRPEPCRASSTAGLHDCTVTQSHSRDPKKPSAYLQAIRPAKVIETYSAGIKLALVSRGEADVYLNTYEAPYEWDVCPGQILVEEAGGMLTHLDGRAVEYGLSMAERRPGLLASNGRVHNAVLQAIR